MLTTELFEDTDQGRNNIIGAYNSAFFGALDIMGARSVDGQTADDIASAVIAKIFECHADDRSIEITSKPSTYFAQAGRNGARDALRLRKGRNIIEAENGHTLQIKPSINATDNELRKSIALADEIIGILRDTLGTNGMRSGSEPNIRLALILVAMGGPSPAWSHYPQLSNAWRAFRRYLASNPELIEIFAYRLRTRMETDVNIGSLISEY